ncbi:hypothetical protein DL93DRAFT_1841896 [Clavulina sp. PMI_390]|nr:hypothetical protein DL93DRAFT_1841896 [Clavulina sp. PMI_390]
MTVHLALKPFKCTEPGCDFATATKFWLHRHIDMHRGIRPFKCEHNDCKSAFTTAALLQIHIRNVHDRRRPFPCLWPKCSLKCTSSWELRAHVDAVHLKKKPFKCSECNRGFSNKNGLREHMKTHETAEFYCPEIGCPRRFAKEGQLAMHRKRDHGIEKPYTCSWEDCEDVFARSDVRRQHYYLVHLKKDPRGEVYKCTGEGCDLVFEKKHQLTDHFLDAHGTPFYCPVCNGKLSSKKSVERHVKKQHPESVENAG